MNSNDESRDDRTPKAMTRRKLLSGAATATTIFGAGCLGDLDEDEGNQTIAPPPEYTETGTGAQETNDTTSMTEEGPAESSTTPEESTTENEHTATASEPSYQVENPNNFGWETQDSLEETTGLCYPDGGYLGALDAEEVESALEEEHLYGNDPNNALNDGELIGAVEPLKPVEGTYAVDVDARQGDEIQYYVQLVGEQDGGVYLNRQGAYEVSELEWQEVFNEC